MFSCSDNIVRTEQVVVENHATNNTPKIVRFYEVKGKTRTWVKEVWYHENGNVNVEGPIKDDKRHGDWKGYYPEGELMSVGRFENGRREGKGTVYHQNGQVSFECEYHEGKPCGLWKYFDEDGNLIDVVDRSN